MKRSRGGPFVAKQSSLSNMNEGYRCPPNQAKNVSHCSTRTRSAFSDAIIKFAVIVNRPQVF